MKTLQRYIIIMLTIFMFSCGQQEKTENFSNKKEPVVEQKEEIKKNNFVSTFEIPATDITRSIKFYETILSLKIESMNIEGMQMGLFPYENQSVFGTIIKSEGYIPSSNGVTIYLNGGNDLQVILDKVEISGGKVLVPKTLHGDESGYFALFIDTEGNKIGLHSQN